MAWAWMIAVLCAMVHLELVLAQQNSTCNATTEQPVVTEVNPPSGTTGQEAGRSSTYFIRGERLDNILSAEITIMVRLGIVHNIALERLNSSAASFRIPQTASLPNGGSPATLALFPANAACQNISINLTVFETGKHTISMIDVSL